MPACASERDPKTIWLCAAVLIAATLIVYANSFAGVLLFDDIPHIVDNKKIHTLWPPWRLLTTRRAALNVTLAINYALHDLDVWGYHLVNLVIHLLAGLTLFGLARRTFLCEKLRDQFGQRATPLAFLIALIWLVHPLCTQAVTYIVQRGESLMGLFYLLTLYALARGASSHRKVAWYAACIIACALGMASKAVMITAPVVAILYDRTFYSGGFVRALRNRWPLYTGLLLSWGVLFALGIVRSTLRTSPNPFAHVGFSHMSVTPWQYAATQPGVIMHYLRLAFWPAELCLDYQWPVANSARAIVPASIVIGLLLLGTFWGAIRRKAYGFAGAAFFLILLPTSSFVPIKDPAFEHRMYLPLAAVVALTACVVYRIARSDRWNRRGGPSVVARATVLSIVIVTVAALGWKTTVRNRAYHSEEAMWRDVATKRPNNPRAYLGIGVELQKKGLLDEALEAYRHALSIDPIFADAWYDVGTVFEAKGAFADAATAYERVIELAPQRLKVYEVLARVLSKDRRFDDAARWYEKLSALDPGKAQWFYEWGNALTDAGAHADAALRFDDATRLDAAHVDAWINLGNARRRTGALPNAIEAYQSAVEVSPDSYIAWVNLANTLAGAGRSDEAIPAFERAIALDPESATAHAGLGWVYNQTGRPNHAVEHFTQALSLDPANELARRGLSVLQADTAAQPE